MPPVKTYRRACFAWAKDADSLGKSRVAMAQGKQGIWLLTFPDRENTGNLVNLEFFENFVTKVATR